MECRWKIERLSDDLIKGHVIVSGVGVHHEQISLFHGEWLFEYVLKDICSHGIDRNTSKQIG